MKHSNTETIPTGKRYLPGWLPFLCLFLFNPALLPAQTPEQQRSVDSLQQLINATAPSDTNLVRHQLALIAVMEQYDMTKAKALALQSLRLASEKGMNVRLAEINTRIGQICAYQAQYDEALEYLLTAERLYKQHGTDYQQSFATYRVAIAYHMMGKKDVAIPILEAYLVKMKQGGYKKQVLSALSNLAVAYHDQKKLDLAIATYTEALQLSEDLKVTSFTVNNAFNLATAYRDQQRYAEAIVLCEKYIPIARSLGEKRSEVLLLTLMGDLYSARAMAVQPITAASRNDAGKSIQYLLASQKIAEEQGLTQKLRDNCLLLSKVHEYLGQDQIALKYLHEHLSLRDSVDASKTDDAIAKIEQKHQQEIKKGEEEVQALKDKQQRTILWVLGIGLLGLVFWLALLFRLRQRSERLLQKILPTSIATRLKSGENPLADRFDAVSVVFIDLVDFTQLSAQIGPDDLVRWLNDLFVQYDLICKKYGLEKIKTIGDCYMAVAGVPIPVAQHAARTVAFAREILELMKTVQAPNGQTIEVRIGCDTGAAVAGVIGEYKFAYDLWGDTVNTAARMEANGLPGQIQCTERFVQALGDEFAGQVSERGAIDIKGKGRMQTWLVQAKAVGE